MDLRSRKFPAVRSSASSSIVTLNHNYNKPRPNAQVLFDDGHIVKANKHDLKLLERIVSRCR